MRYSLHSEFKLELWKRLLDVSGFLNPKSEKDVILYGLFINFHFGTILRRATDFKCLLTKYHLNLEWTFQLHISISILYMYFANVHDL